MFFNTVLIFWVIAQIGYLQSKQVLFESENYGF